MSAPLTGDALIARVDELKPASEASIAIECGYVSESGKARLAAFKSALLDAHGLGLAPAKGTGKGRPLSFVVTVGTKGQIVLGGGYSELIGVAPGEQVEIRLQDQALVISKPGAVAAAAACPAVVAGEVVTYDSAPARELAAA
jgi:bifunctional DNA-binding transcriptional regulator/antitoxin component of YhaV-PrlF toxin-antitoxin module